MEFFRKAKVVRLRSYQDKYMLANDDEENIFQDRNMCNVDNAKWTVEIVENSNVIRLKSCYGKYLTATNIPFILRGTGKKVLQTLPTRLNSSMEWEPIRDGVQVKLRTRHGHYLRGNGGLPPWRNTITHDVPRRTATTNWILWDVDIVELLPQAQIPKLRPSPTPIAPPIPSMNPISIDNAPPSPLSPIVSEMDSLFKIHHGSPPASKDHHNKIWIKKKKLKKIVSIQIASMRLKNLKVD